MERNYVTVTLCITKSIIINGHHNGSDRPHRRCVTPLLRGVGCVRRKLCETGRVYCARGVGHMSPRKCRFPWGDLEPVKYLVAWAHTSLSLNWIAIVLAIVHKASA